MKDGNKTVKGNRRIITVCLPLDLADWLQWLVDRYGLSRSDFVSKAIVFYLNTLGIKKDGD